MSENQSIVVAINDEINKELADSKVGAALLATTFKGLDAVRMKQALMEGMITGFTFKDFLQKHIYAIPYSNGYSLMTSVDFARKRGARGGVIGKSKPIYRETENGKILSCEVTVYTKDGHPDGYTAEVYFDEYDTGKNLWVKKPRTMIAKVAEMHALRMACPEDLSKLYIEEEFDQEIENKDRITDVKVEATKLNMDNFREELPQNQNGDDKETKDQKDQIDGNTPDNNEG